MLCHPVWANQDVEDRRSCLMRYCLYILTRDMLDCYTILELRNCNTWAMHSLLANSVWTRTQRLCKLVIDSQSCRWLLTAKKGKKVIGLLLSWERSYAKLNGKVNFPLSLWLCNLFRDFAGKQRRHASSYLIFKTLPHKLFSASLYVKGLYTQV